MNLSNEMIAELDAINEAEMALGRPSSLFKSHWHGVTGELARMRLVTWRRGGAAWSDRFREVGMTDKGRKRLAEIPDAERRAIVEAEMAKYEDEEIGD